MSYPIPNGVKPVDAVPTIKIVEVGGLYFRSAIFAESGTIIPQHVHDHDHVTFIGSGRFRGWKDGEWIGDRSAGEVFHIQAGASHLFMSLEEHSMLTCVHTIESALSVKEKGL